MTPYQFRLNRYIERMAKDMKIRNMAQSTIDAYTWHVTKFCEFFDSPSGEAGTRRDPPIPAVHDRTEEIFVEFVQSSGLWPTLPVRSVLKTPLGGAAYPFRETPQETARGALRPRSNPADPMCRQSQTPHDTSDGYHTTQSQAYLARCRELLPPSDDETEDAREPGEPVKALLGRDNQYQCPHCEVALECTSNARRPSWKQVFERDIYRDASLYVPIHHIYLRGPPQGALG